MNYAWIVPAVLFVLVIVPLIGYFYGQQRRWTGAAGWFLLLGGQVMLQAGAGEWFAWAGLFWLGVSAFGLVLVVLDMFTSQRTFG
jgi:prepilin signal peptidase PulO-like enzyme (type II secretory pathway)